MANTQWFVEPTGKQAKHTNEVIAGMLRDIDDSHEIAFELHKRVLVISEGGFKYLTSKILCAVPEYAFITKLSGISEVSFKTYRREGNGRIEQLNLEHLKRAKRKKLVRDNVRLAE